MSQGAAFASFHTNIGRPSPAGTTNSSNAPRIAMTPSSARPGGRAPPSSGAVIQAQTTSATIGASRRSALDQGPGLPIASDSILGSSLPADSRVVRIRRIQASGIAMTTIGSPNMAQVRKSMRNPVSLSTSPAAIALVGGTTSVPSPPLVAAQAPP